MTDLFVNRPVTCLCLFYLVLILLTTFCVVLEYFATTKDTNRDYLIWDNFDVEQWDKMTLAQQTVAESFQKNETL